MQINPLDRSIKEIQLSLKNLKMPLPDELNQCIITAYSNTLKMRDMRFGKLGHHEVNVSYEELEKKANRIKSINAKIDIRNYKFSNKLHEVAVTPKLNDYPILQLRSNVFELVVNCRNRQARKQRDVASAITEEEMKNKVAGAF